MGRVAEVEFHYEATAEFDAATDWYGEKSEQAAEDFIGKPSLEIARITKRPWMWLNIYTEHRGIYCGTLPTRLFT